MSIPALHPVSKLSKKDFHAPTYAAIERRESPLFNGEMDGDIGLLVGPEGGFSKSETDWLLTHANIIPCSLGDRILRAETAAIFMLSRIV
jgi:16S rRNA (uracil1498-N3)-methyltransferase